MSRDIANVKLRGFEPVTPSMRTTVTRSATVKDARFRAFLVSGDQPLVARLLHLLLHVSGRCMHGLLIQAGTAEASKPSHIYP